MDLRGNHSSNSLKYWFKNNIISEDGILSSMKSFDPSSSTYRVLKLLKLERGCVNNWNVNAYTEFKLISKY